MPGLVISSVEQVTAAWLTSVLSRSSAVTAGRVTDVALDEGHGNWSTHARIRLHYSVDAVGDRPQRLFLKMVLTDLGDGESFGGSEVDY